LPLSTVIDLDLGREVDPPGRGASARAAAAAGRPCRRAFRSAAGCRRLAALLPAHARARCEGHGIDALAMAVEERPTVSGELQRLEAAAHAAEPSGWRLLVAGRLLAGLGHAALPVAVQADRPDRVYRPTAFRTGGGEDKRPAVGRDGHAADRVARAGKL